MKMIRKAVSVAVLAVLALVGTLGVVKYFEPTVAEAGPVLAVKQLKWRDGIGIAAASLPSDTTFLTDEADTTRTYPIDTYDWDWGAIGAAGGGVATGVAGARVIFVATAASNFVTDSIYFNVEKGSGQDSLFTQSGTITAAVGSVALPEGTAGAGAGDSQSRVFSGVLMCDPDTPGASNVWLVPSFRLRVAGDQSGTTPKLSGLKVYVVYPRRQESQ